MSGVDKTMALLDVVLEPVEMEPKGLIGRPPQYELSCYVDAGGGWEFRRWRLNELEVAKILRSPWDDRLVAEWIHEHL